MLWFNRTNRHGTFYLYGLCTLHIWRARNDNIFRHEEPNEVVNGPTNPTCLAKMDAVFRRESWEQIRDVNQVDWINSHIDSNLEGHIFCDKVVHKNTNKLGIECIIAYNNDSVILAKISGPKQGNASLMIESLAIEDALNFAIQCGRRKVGFFNNSQIIIESILKSQSDCQWEIYAED